MTHMAGAGMTFKIEYASKRSEVWNWYWRSWLRSLWKVHLAAFLVVSASVYVLAGGQSRSVWSVFDAIGIGVLTVSVMPLYPQLMFKPQVRVFEVDADGIQTSIAKRSAKLAWGDIRSISEDQGYIVFTGKNGNAFIIPPRAFASPIMQDEFLSFVRRSMGLGQA